MFEDLLIALENLEEQDRKKRGKLAFESGDWEFGCRLYMYIDHFHRWRPIINYFESI